MKLSVPTIIIDPISCITTLLYFCQHYSCSNSVKQSGLNKKDISLFYFLDLFFSSIFLFVKRNKISDFQKVRQNNSALIGKLVFLYVLLFFLGIQIFNQLHSDFDFFKATTRFILLKDMGLPQGIFLLPLLIYTAYLNYKMKFLQLKMYEKRSIFELTKAHLNAFYLLISSLALVFVLTIFIPIYSELLLIILVVLTGVYSYYFRD